MVKRRLKETTYYDSRNIIDMANYVAFLADSFCTASKKGYPQLCRKRQTRALQMVARGDYIPCDAALTTIGEISHIVMNSKTKSPIADGELRRAACILRDSGVHPDPRIRNLMTLENDR